MQRMPAGRRLGASWLAAKMLPFVRRPVLQRDTALMTGTTRAQANGPLGVMQRAFSRRTPGHHHRQAGKL